MARKDNGTGYGSNDLLSGEEARVRVKTCPRTFDNDEECMYDWCNEPHKLKKGEFYLPHSCQEWAIGTKEQALMLIEDLKRLMEEKP